MRTWSVIRQSFIGMGIGVVVLGGCTVTVKTQTKYTTPNPVTGTSNAAWTNEQVIVYNQNGDTTIIADPSATHVSFSATPFAFADNQTDGNAAIADVETTLKIDESVAGQIKVNCQLAINDHGSAKNGTTGCSLSATVPAGSTTQGLPLEGYNKNGSISTQGTFTAPSNGRIFLHCDNGDITVPSGLIGNVTVQTPNGSVDISATPTVGSTIDVSTDNGVDSILHLPSNFATDSLVLAPTNGKVVFVGFNDLAPTATSRGPAGTGAKLVSLKNGNGDVTLENP